MDGVFNQTMTGIINSINWYKLCLHNISCPPFTLIKVLTSSNLITGFLICDVPHLFLFLFASFSI